MEEEELGTKKMTITVYEFHQDWLDGLASKIPLPKSTLIQFVLWRLWKNFSANQDIRNKLNSSNLEAELVQMKLDGARFLEVKKEKVRELVAVAEGEI